MGAAGVVRAAALCGLLFPLISAQEGILNVFSNDNPLLNNDYCIIYNPFWTSLPGLLSNSTSTRLIDVVPKFLCTTSEVPSDALKDKAVLVMRGNCTFLEKAWIAQSLGAKILLIASNTGLVTPPGEKNVSIPIALISYTDAIDIETSLGKNVNVTLYSPRLPEFDFSIVIIFLIAVLTVVLGGYWSGLEELEEVKAAAVSENGELSRKISETVIFSPMKIVVFVVFSCIMLVLLYFFYIWLVYVIIAIFSVASAVSLYICLAVLMKKITWGRCGFQCGNTHCQVRLVFLAGFCIATSAIWIVYRNEDRWVWILQDILGIAFCLNFIKTLRLPNFKSCVILLGLLLVYDVFFVFITPYITKSGESIMVEVATGPDRNSEKLSFGWTYVGLCNTVLQLPVVMRVPRFQFCMPMACGVPFSLLGFGDIILPGLLVAYCRRFDVQRSSTARPLYYISSCVAYAIGMLITFMALSLMKMAQPALLYLVPCVLVTSTLVALIREEMKKFWEGSNYQVMVPGDFATTEDNSTISSEQCGEE